MMTLSTPQTDILKQLVHTFVESGANGLGAMMGANLTLGSIDPVRNDHWSDLPDRFEGESPLFAEVQLRGPFDEKIGLLLKSNHAKLLADLMLGNDPDTGGTAITDMQISGVGECVNQLMNGGTQAINETLSQRIDVATANAVVETPEILEEWESFFGSGAFFSFHGQWQLNNGNGINQAIDFVLLIREREAERLVALTPNGVETAPIKETATAPQSISQTVALPQPAMAMAGHVADAGVGQTSGMPGQYPSAYGNAMPYASMPQSPGYGVPPVMAQPVQFTNFDAQSPQAMAIGNENLNLLMDINLNLHVELGRTNLSIKNILELTRGSVVELDKVAGEAVDLYANGKLIARGEVVVIEDNFGLRVTSIVSPAERLRGLG
jgi:flagellar motor switch protein FliN